MIGILGEQIASPVQFVKGLETLYRAGARVFVEIGPKKALQGFVKDVLGDRGDVVALFTNHPKQGDVVSFNQALCGLYAAGLGAGVSDRSPKAPIRRSNHPPTRTIPNRPAVEASPPQTGGATGADGTYERLGRLFAEFLDRGQEIYRSAQAPSSQTDVTDRPKPIRPVVVSGAGLGLPGLERVFDEKAVARLLSGEQLIDSLPLRAPPRHRRPPHHAPRQERGWRRSIRVDRLPRTT